MAMQSLSKYFSHLFSSGEVYYDELIDDFNNKGKLQSDVNASNPNRAWRQRLNKCMCKTVKPLDPNTPIQKDYVRFVCISDTHTVLEKSNNIKIPDGDVLLHAGDFSMHGMPDEVAIVNRYLGTLPHKHKVIIAGNHDSTFDKDYVEQKAMKKWSLPGKDLQSQLRHHGVESTKDMLKDCIYLEDSSVEIYGIKIYGSPWTVGRGFWGFQRRYGPGLMRKWNQIPTDTDILITHCPPCGYGDIVDNGVSSKLKRLAGGPTNDHIGCVDLLNTVQKRVKPKYHLYGHIHEGYGVRTDGTTTFINAAICDEKYAPNNPPIVFDVPLPDGFSKTPDEEIAKKKTDVCNNSENTPDDCKEGAELFETTKAVSDEDESEDELEVEKRNGNVIGTAREYADNLNMVDEEDEYFFDNVETDKNDIEHDSEGPDYVEDNSVEKEDVKDD